MGVVLGGGFDVWREGFFEGEEAKERMFEGEEEREFVASCLKASGLRC